MINQIKNMLSKMSPEQVAMNMIGDTNNPMLQNLVQMAKKGDKQGIEQFARNFYSERGRNFDDEFANFMQNFKQ